MSSLTRPTEQAGHHPPLRLHTTGRFTKEDSYEYGD